MKKGPALILVTILTFSICLNPVIAVSGAEIDPFMDEQLSGDITDEETYTERSVFNDVAEHVLQYGGYPDESENGGIILLAPDGDIVIREVISDFLKGRTKNGTLDVSDYALTDRELISEIIPVVNDDPALFDLYDIIFTVNDATGIVGDVRFEFADGAKERFRKYENAVNTILDGIEDSWTDIEKLIYLHDYLVTHCQYDLDYKNRTAYDAVVDGTCTCQGYSLAYTDLVRRAGMDAMTVSSRSLNHVWNIAGLDGSMYHIDTTWDDPLKNNGHHYSMFCNHTFFLCSESKLRSKDHYGNDWIASGENVCGRYNDKRFDRSPLNTAKASPTVCLGHGRILYIDNTSVPDIYEYDHNEKTDEQICSLPSDNGYGYGTLTYGGADIFVNDEYSIYRLDLSEGELYRIYKLDKSERRLGRIYGIEADESGIRYDIGTKASDSGYVTSGYVDIRED